MYLYRKAKVAIWMVKDLWMKYKLADLTIFIQRCQVLEIPLMEKQDRWACSCAMVSYVQTAYRERCIRLSRWIRTRPC